MHTCTHERAIKRRITDVPTSLRPEQFFPRTSIYRQTQNRSLPEVFDGSSPTSKGCLCRV